MKKENEILGRVLSRGTQKIEHFQPGELVTAERLNEIIDAIELLKERVTKLEERCK